MPLPVRPNGLVRHHREGSTVTAVTGSPFEVWTRTANSQLVSRVKLLVPMIPPTFYAAGVSYREHVTEMAHRRGVKPEFPPNADVGYRANNALTATDEPIVIPKDATDQVQYEGELVVVIGKRCKRVSEAQALDVVLGYTIGTPRCASGSGSPVPARSAIQAVGVGRKRYEAFPHEIAVTELSFD